GRAHDASGSGGRNLHQATVPQAQDTARRGAAYSRDRAARITLEDPLHPLRGRTRKPFVTAEDHVGYLQPWLVVAVVDIVEQVDGDRDRHAVAAGMSQQRPGKPR